jgi:hypothetical protein
VFVGVDIGTMSDLRKTLGDLYESAPDPAPAAARGDRSRPALDDDLAEALSAALVSAPTSTGPSPVADPATTGPQPAGAAPTPAGIAARSRMAGTLRELHRDAPKTPAAGEPSAPQPDGTGPAAGPVAPAAAKPATPSVEPLPGDPWLPANDNILPSGGATKAARGIHLTRGRKK